MIEGPDTEEAMHESSEWKDGAVHSNREKERCSGWTHILTRLRISEERGRGKRAKEKIRLKDTDTLFSSFGLGVNLFLSLSQLPNFALLDVPPRSPPA